MFSGFAGVWTPIVPSRSLGKKPLALRLADEPVALFRDGDGRVGALIDRCPHRGVALSLGRVNERGCLECPFHGWSFARDGACVNIPLNVMPADKRERYAATGLPVRESGGLIWVFTGTDSAGTEPSVPEALTEPGWTRWIHDEVWNAHWTRAMENMLDTPHVPFVHRRTIGRAMRARMRPDSVLRMTVEPEPYGARFVAELDGESTGAALRWRRPNGMELHIPIPDKKMRLQIFCVPIDALHTRMIVIASRNFLHWGPLAWLSNQFNRYIVFEDRALVQSSQPPEVPPPGDEVSIASDGPTLHFRRYYFRELKQSGGEALIPASRLTAPSTP
jgi:phenylpropionate dioxygenase-like ring-hydroxylating dioxygenase large terminal subunit